MNKLIKHFTYRPIVKRRLISSKTKKIDFIDKLDEEVLEVKEAYTFNESLSEEEAMELMDVIFVCLNTLFHFKVNVIKLLFSCYKKNQKRISHD